MIINLELDTAAAAAPLAVRNIWQQAANIIASMFTDNITINISVDYSGTGGGANAGPAAGLFESYSSIYADLKNGASPGDSSFDALPVPGAGNAPVNIVVWNAQQKALGLLAGNAPGLDGSSHFDTDISQSLLLGVALHEFTHAMGRIPDGNPDIMELDRFSSPGTRVYDGGVPAAEASYFSLNGGATKWADYGVHSDPSDTMNNYNFGGDGPSPLSPEDPFNQFYDSNTLQYLTPLDLEQMDILGFHLKQDAPASDSYDFNGGNSGDLLIQSANGSILYGNMAGGAFQNWVNVGDPVGWNVVGEGKISGNADADIVIQNASSSEIFYAAMVNGAFSHWVDVAGAPGYNVVGVGDINDDHYADIVIENHSDGTILYANMAGGVFNGWKAVSSAPGWSVSAVADINDDGYADVVIQKNSDGSILYANMAGGVFNNWVSVGDPVGWKVVGAGDIARDGYADIVIQDQSDGSIAFANMKNGVFNNWVNVGDPAGWNVIAVEDILGNGFDDIVIQNASTGQIDYADMTTGTFQRWVPVTDPVGYQGLSQPFPAGSGNGANGAGSSGGSSQVRSDSTTALATSFDGGGASGSSPDPLTGQVPMPDFNIAPASGRESPSGKSNTLSGVTISDPPASPGGSVPGLIMFDPPALNGGAPSAASAFDTGPQNGGNSASWLTNGALPGGTSINNGDQNSANGTAPVVAADNLTHLLKLGT